MSFFYSKLPGDGEADDLSVLTKPETVFEDEHVSPFIKYDDGYQWPDLYTELDECLEANLLVYPLAKLRKLAKSKKLKHNADAVLKMPITHTQVMDVVQRNRGNNKLTDESYMSILESCREREMLSSIENSDGDSKQRRNTVHLTPATIVAFHDRYSKEELTFMVTVNHVRQRMTICFSGSGTKHDWATDFQIGMKETPNPVAYHSSQESVVHIHYGFYNYLFEQSERRVKSLDGKSLSEYEEILQEHLLPFLRKYPTYKLYVTGHGLGAALAVLFGFMAAAEPDYKVPKPVTLVSIACPYVGDASFLSAHQLLESQGKLRHLRVSNDKDSVTLLPKLSWRLHHLCDAPSHVGYSFKHVGIHLRLYGGDSAFEINYPKVRSGYFASLYEEFWRGWDQQCLVNCSWNCCDYYAWPCHQLKEYNRRAVIHKPSLKSIQLNELYARPDIVGNLVAQF